MEIADMRAAVDARLAQDVAPQPQDATVPLSEGFAPALRAAVAANARYRSAAAREREAAERIGVAASALRPALSGDANIGAIRETGGRGPSTSNAGIAGGLTVSQLVYDAGGTEAAVNRATAEAVAAIADRLAAGNEVALNAGRAWIDLWQYSERLRLLRGRTSDMDMLLTQIERLSSTGMVDRASLDAARRQIVDISLEETRLEAGLDEARSRFARFFNARPSEVGQPAAILSVDEARRMTRNWQRAPDLQREAAQLLAAQAALVEANAAFQPRARLQAGIRTPLEREESTDLTVGLMLDYSFSDGGRRARQLNAARERVTAQEARLEDLQRELMAELEGADTQLASIERSLPLVVRKIELSRSEAETAQSQILTGQSSVRQVVEAEIEAYRAEDQRVVLAAERQSLLLTVAARTGELRALIALQE
ncbi:TolC family protein [Rhodobaculum claviforme]|uniref:TolC family protein n=1 Tax=Rhodobaculum claviforme TaxID=1549854 RepID=UPI0019149B77